jgi:hypothetical protein
LKNDSVALIRCAAATAATATQRTLPAPAAFASLLRRQQSHRPENASCEVAVRNPGAHWGVRAHACDAHAAADPLKHLLEFRPLGSEPVSPKAVPAHVTIRGLIAPKALVIGAN